MTVEKSEYKGIPHLFTTRKEVEAFNCSVFNAAAEHLKIVVEAVD